MTHCYMTSHDDQFDYHIFQYHCKPYAQSNMMLCIKKEQTIKKRNDLSILNIVHFGGENLHNHFELQRDWNMINPIILRNCQIFMNSIAWRQGVHIQAYLSFKYTKWIDLLMDMLIIIIIIISEVFQTHQGSQVLAFSILDALIFTCCKTLLKSLCT